MIYNIFDEINPSFMKHISIFITFFLFSFFAFAQVPNQVSGINYQGIAREADGTPIADNTIDVAITIMDNGGSTIFSETHNGVLTNQFGLFTLIIGSQTPLTSDLWNQATEIKTEADFGSGMVEIGTVDLAAVPYAFKAKYEGQKIEYSSSNNRLYITDGNGTYIDSVTIASGGSSLPAGGTNGQILATDGSGNYSWVNDNITDNDADPVNELQTLELDGDSTIRLKDANGNTNSVIQIPNDSQTLNLSGTVISIRNGNNIDLGSIIPAGGTDDQNLDSAVLSGTNLSIYIEGGNNASVDLSGLQDGTGTDAQTLSLSGNTLSISNGNNVTLTDNINDADADPTNEIELPTGGTNGQILATDGSGNYSWVNENAGTDSQNLTSSVSGSNATINISGGSSTTFSINDADADPTNEIELPTGGTNGQILSTDGSGNYSWINENAGTDDQNISGSSLSGTTLTIGIENGSSQTVDLSSLAEADNDWFLGGSTTAKPTTINDDIWKRGNVGIFGTVGLTTISHKLTVGQTSNTTTPMVAIKNGHATGDASLLFQGGTSYYSIGSDAGNSSFTISQNSTGLGSNDRLVIKNSTGNIGIGTSSPGAKLDIKTNNATTDALYIGQSTSLPQLVVQAGGNVGIGTASPSVALDVVKNGSNIYVASFTNTNTSNSHGLKIETASTNSNNTLFYAQSSINESDFIIKGDGDVGIGTNNPTSKLEVKGTITIDNSADPYELNRSSTGNANLVPIAYANVSSSGALNTSSNNVTVNKVGTGQYAISVAGESLTVTNSIVSINTQNSNPRFVGYGSLGGNIYVYIRNSSSNFTDNSFSISIFKP